MKKYIDYILPDGNIALYKGQETSDENAIQRTVMANLKDGYDCYNQVANYLLDYSRDKTMRSRDNISFCIVYAIKNKYFELLNLISIFPKHIHPTEICYFIMFLYPKRYMIWDLATYIVIPMLLLMFAPFPDRSPLILLSATPLLLNPSIWLQIDNRYMLAITWKKRPKLMERIKGFMFFGKLIKRQPLVTGYTEKEIAMKRNIHNYKLEKRVNIFGREYDLDIRRKTDSEIIFDAFSQLPLKYFQIHELSSWVIPKLKKKFGEDYAHNMRDIIFWDKSHPLLKKN